MAAHSSILASKTPWTNEPDISVCAQSCQLVAKLCIVACQGPLSTGFSRQEFWSRLPFPPLGDLPNPGIETTFPVSPAL